MFKIVKLGKTDNITFERKVIILVFLFIFLIIIVMILTIKIKIEIINFKFTSVLEKHINKNYEIRIILYTFEKLPILKLKINDSKIHKIFNNKKINKIIKDEDGKIIFDKNNIDKEIINSIKKLKIDIKKMKLKIDIGTENALTTAFLVPIISTIISIFLAKKVKKYNKNQVFYVLPIYKDRNLINIDFSGIFEIKMIHIINTICIYKKRKGDKNERTSNRRTYADSYE